LEQSLQGISADAKIEGVGVVRWEIIDENGVARFIETEAFFVPTASIRLHSPQFHFKNKLEGSLLIDHVFSQGPFGSTKKGFACDIHHVARENPLFEYFNPTIPDQFGDLRAFLLDAGTANLKFSEYELLSWHCRMGHVGMSRLQKVMSWDKEKLEGSLLIDHHGAKLTLANEGSGVVALSFPYWENEPASHA
jgi:hypothetical protein